MFSNSDETKETPDSSVMDEPIEQQQEVIEDAEKERYEEHMKTLEEHSRPVGSKLNDGASGAPLPDDDDYDIDIAESLC